MTRILVCNPPAYLYNDRRHFIQAGSRWSFSMDAEKGNHKWPHYQPYPFALGYATSILKQEGYRVDAFDGSALDMNEIEFMERVIKSNPDIMMIEVPTVSFPLVMRLLNKIKNNIGCTISVTGPHITALPGSTEFEKLPGEWESHLPYDPIEFGDYPFPDREFFPNEQYSNFEYARPSAQMLSSKGCHGRCAFCLEQHVIYRCRKIRTRTPENVVDEMELLKENGAKGIWFDDMSITSKKGHIQGICNEILDRELDLPWSAFSCIGDENATEETISLMSNAGCFGLAFGIETITKKALKLAGKTYVSPKSAKKFNQLLQKHEIHTVASYIIGLPGETRDTIPKTIKFALDELGSDSLQFAIATPLPGTPFFKLCEQNGWLTTKEDWTRYDGARHSVVNYPDLSGLEIEAFFKQAMWGREEKKMGFRK